MKKITVIGTGYVGLVSGTGMADFGHEVVCADIDPDKINQLKQGEIPIYEPGLKEMVQRNVSSGRLQFTTDVPEVIQRADVIFIAVGTPQGSNGEADLGAVEAAAKTIGQHLNGYTVVCTKSTVPIGTGAKIISLINEHSKSSSEFDYVSNPEFLREGAAVKDFTHPDRIVIGSTSEKASEWMRDVYRPLYINETPMIFTSVETAEMIKYASNAFLALKISYINEIANLCEAIRADVHVVTRAMGLDGRISSKFLHPGPGYGGSCFPKDTHALAAMGQNNGSPLKTVESAISANEKQKNRMIHKFKVLVGGSFSGKTLAVLGLSFKPETDDIRESPALPMIRTIMEEGAFVRAYDPIAMGNMKQKFSGIQYCKTWQDAVDSTDGAVILTEWNEFRGMDLDELKSRMKIPAILDTKNILSLEQLSSLGFTFDCVGRRF